MLRVYRVTELASILTRYWSVPDETLKDAQQRGTLVHSLCAAYARSRTFHETSDKDIRGGQGYFLSFKRWFDDYVAEVVSVETSYTNIVGIIGHPDLVAVIRGDQAPSIIDLKTAAAHDKIWRLQMAGYKHIVRNHAISNGATPPERIFSLRLDPNGGPAKLREYTDTYLDDLAVLFSLVNIQRFIDSAE
ncbi:MAG TPA: hypothetical protein PKM59_06130 [Thermodesulfobacteriota bacterium]|nr:hypothetical protein [Thermodesulfobacteriota bacterium]HNU71840.1 hypothetical protein [Thermodesulfobacteriota bacterium]